MRSRRDSDRRGIALVIALFALVVIGALVAAVFFAAQLEVRSGTNVVSGLQADQAAQAGLEYAAANWSRAWVQQGVGNSMGIDWVQLGSTSGYFSDSITQLNDQLLLVRAFGQARNGAGGVVASRTGGLLFKVAPPDFGLAAAVTFDGNVVVNNKDTLSGVDLVPPVGAWSANCASLPRSDRPAVRSSGSITASGPNYSIAPSSSPSDPSVATSVAKVNGVFSTLQGMADLTFTSASAPTSIAPVLSGHTCASGTAQPANWGDPTYAPSGTDGTGHPCASYFPIIYVDASSGTFIPPAGAGEGVLLVSGNVRFHSSFKFYGVVLVTGTVMANGGGATDNLFGGLLGGSTANLGGNDRFDYSSCAVTLAAQAALIGRPLSVRPYIPF
jgi:hypothetical protein